MYLLEGYSIYLLDKLNVELTFNTTGTVIGSNGDAIGLLCRLMVDRIILQTLQDITVVIKRLIENIIEDLLANTFL